MYLNPTFDYLNINSTNRIERGNRNIILFPPLTMDESLEESSVFIIDNMLGHKKVVKIQGD